MASIIRVSDVLNQSGTAGISVSESTQRLQLQAAGFVLSPTIASITPVGKTRVAFTFLATDQSFVVPGGVTYILVKLWASGGGGGSAGPGWTFGSWGGGGGFTTGIVPVTPGETLTVRVPRGGFAFPGATNAPFGGGSSTTGADNTYGAGGGGYCGLFRSGSPLLIAGAGGGGGAIVSAQGMSNGGAGGGLNGMRGESARTQAFAGGGGTQAAGGAGGTGNNSAGQAGSSLLGGSVIGSPYGGGGGGGYFGGGAGSYGSGNTMGGGGGGSGFVASGVIYGATVPGSGANPANTDDPDYPPSTVSTFTSVGRGGIQAWNGGDGYMVIYY